MNSISNSKKSYSKQMAAGYIAYMMGGSYFHRCKCKNPGEESRLYLHYVEMPREQQYRQEERVLQFMEGLSPLFLKWLSGLNCEARCRRREDDYVVEFLTGGFDSIQCVVEKNGNIRIIPFAG